MAKVNIELVNANKDFRNGFLAALDFLDGVESISLDFYKDKTAGITFDDGGGNDNATYRLLRGKLKFYASGVER